MPRSVRCHCGAYRELEMGAFGLIFEVCRCGVRESLRGRLPDDAQPLAPYTPRGPITDRPCQWPAGCAGYASAYNTDLCARHAQERRREKDREYRRRLADEKWAKLLNRGVA